MNQAGGFNRQKISFHGGFRRSQPPPALAVPLSRVGGGSGSDVRPPRPYMRILFVMAGAAIVMTGCQIEHSQRPNSISADRQPVVALPFSDNDTATRPCIYISREVKKSGVYTWTSGMTLTDAISFAGGLSDFARRSRIRIFRKDHSTAKDYNYDDILKHKTKDPLLMPGDRVFVSGDLD